eukprot:Nk52_evm31s2356 gene=Nk52_evmTU31s2356
MTQAASASLDIPTTGKNGNGTQVPDNTPNQPAPITASFPGNTMPSISEAGKKGSDAKASALAGFSGALQGALKDKLEGLIGCDSGYVDNLPESVKRRINALKNVQEKYTELRMEFHKEVHELERKYLELYAPLFGKRADIVNGKYEPTESECEWESDEEEDSDEEDEELASEMANAVKIKDGEEKAANEDEEEDSVNGIPEFWATAMKNCDEIDAMIFECDSPILSHLTDIRIEMLGEDELGFFLNFYFSKNEFFKNEVLTKTYYLSLDGEFDEPTFSQSEGTKIKWFPGKNVTVKMEKKKSKVRGKKFVTKEVVCESFFNFFNPPKVPEEDEMEEDELDTIREELAMDFENGENFRLRLIPNAVYWFTGEAMEDTYDASDLEDEDSESEDAAETGDSESDDDYVPSQQTNQDKPPECKQQ